MELSWLYPRGTKLSEVPHDFQGMPGSAAARQRIFAEIARCAASPETAAYWARFLKAGKSPLSWQHVWTPRDDYGMKGVR